MTFQDWQRAIRTHATAAGVELPDATVDEIAEHLEDIRAAAGRDGCSEAEAAARARTALEESTLEVLREHAARRAAAREFADTVPVPPAPGKSLNMRGAFRLAIRQ